MEPYEQAQPRQSYSLAYVKSFEGREAERRPGGRTTRHDVSLRKWRMTIQLDENRVWFLSVSVDEDGTFDRYSLDEELAEQPQVPSARMPARPAATMMSFDMPNLLHASHALGTSYQS